MMNLEWHFSKNQPRIVIRGAADIRQCRDASQLLSPGSQQMSSGWGRY
jgi:hypothetical protein